jgi:hypothetical protein
LELWNSDYNTLSENRQFVEAGRGLLYTAWAGNANQYFASLREPIANRRASQNVSVLQRISTAKR